MTQRTSRQTPLSFADRPASVVYLDSGRVMRDAKYYRTLALMLQHELGLQDTGLCAPIRVIVLTRAQMAVIGEHNPDIQMLPVAEDTAGAVGKFLFPVSIFILSSDMGDDTFFHEYLHELASLGYVFQDVRRDEVHDLIYMNERLMLTTDSYLRFIKEENSDGKADQD